MINGLVSDFFFEAIARIPCGMLFLVLYWHKELASHKADSYFMAEVLVLAWILGCAVEGVVYGCGKIFLEILGNIKILKGDFLNKIRDFVLKEHGSIIGNENKSNTNNTPSKYALFVSGTTIMARNFWVILFISIFSPPEPFSSFTWHQHFGMVGSFCFFIMWLFYKGAFEHDILTATWNFLNLPNHRLTIFIAWMR